MAIRVDVYTVGGMASGTMSRVGSLREALAIGDGLTLEATVWQALEESTARPAGTVVIPVDDILFAIADDEPSAPIHAAWHHVLLDSGPYSLEGDLATMPGFDPGRSLARPTGEFVLLRDVRLSLHGHPEAGVSVGDHALVNRYAVERIRADLMLGFFFPGAAMGPPPNAATGSPRAQVVGGAV
jgi:hypothetical protein